MPTHSKRRRLLFRCALVGFLLLATVAAAELVMRLVWAPPELFRVFNVVPVWSEPEPFTFEPLPGFVGAFQEGTPQDLPPSARFEPRILDIRVNAQGLRGPDLASKLPGERRVLFGGDSLTFGHGVAEEESFPAQTGRLIGSAGVPITVCNAGVPGYGFVATQKRLRRLQDAVAADALVAGYFLGNDPQDDIWQRTCVVVDARMFQGPFGNLVLNTWRGPLCVRSRLWLFGELWMWEHAPEWSLLPWFRLNDEQAARVATQPAGKTIGCLFLDGGEQHVWNPGQPPATATWLRDLDDTLAALARHAGQRPVLVVVLPTQFHIDAGLRTNVLREVGLDADLLRLGSAQQHIAERCARHGIHCVDATPALAAAGAPASLYDIDHLHLSVRGNEIVARAIAEPLRRLLQR